MKKILVFLLLLLSFYSFAQKTADDSTDRYRQELYKIRKTYMDSLTNNPAYKEALEGYNRNLARSASYFSFNYYFETGINEMDGFNNALKANDFEAMKTVFSRFGIGFTRKSGQFITDYLMMFGINNKAKKGEEKIQSHSSDFQLTTGYDLIKNRNIDIYPFVGLYLRGENLNYKKPAALNVNPGFLTDVIINNQSVSLAQFKAGYMYGLGFDFVLGKKEQSSNTIFGVRVGMTNNFGKEKYRFDKKVSAYQPGIQANKYFIGINFKFFTRG